MQFDLSPHPASPPGKPPFKVWANVDYSGEFGATASLNMWFGVSAPASRFVLPDHGEPGRRDELWRSTCFEAFLRPDGDSAYQEWNFAPAGDWAAYDFTARREGMAEAAVVAPPYVRTEDNLTWWAFGATLSIESGRRWALGLSAVLEERDGTISHWALAHNGDRPDFHDPACFTAALA
ncbi:MAG: DOMON-like domain-containing protein [Sphingomicrobium sp.]